MLSRLLPLLAALVLGQSLAALADTPAVAPPARWLDGLTFSGEVRVLFDGTFTDTTMGVSDRLRGRFGVYLGAKKKFGDQVTAAVRLATGTNVNPVYPNTSFDNGNLGKAIVIDHAYLDLVPLARWESLPDPLQSMRVVVGKQPIPFRYIASFVWDPDLSLEGASEVVRHKSGRWVLGAAAGQYFFEDNAAPDDPYQFSQTVSVDHLPAAAGGFTWGAWAGLHHTIRPFTIDGTFQSLSNFTAPQHSTPSGFSVLEASGYAIRTFGSLPVRVAGGYCRNLSAAPNLSTGRREDEGWLADLTLGRATSARRTWELGGGYRLLEADAALGQLTDFLSTTAGATDAKSVFVHGVFMLWDDVSLGATWFRGESAGARRGTSIQRLDATLSARF